ncbi:hypothetical protein DI396_13410 [Litorivita pollutaquae]|uniref:Uncharacterized protein n=1 Tax=Litorivita pollutaquae TaxID=2200892 RepID=A0A2V4MRF3_9RHOB|nr:hypothetical protein [Litorivita pollutaquae]OUS22149.1 hypothetical protein A9Q95_03735 [Rhodobacterales bacterium 59_46_T64]PYC46718.1 hypothetical protein DI396_13410 [Litorivita pollutaquae]
MKTPTFDAQIETLEAAVEAADAQTRVALQSKVHALVCEMRRQGVEVPAHLSHIDCELTDEAVEAQFDNLPV